LLRGDPGMQLCKLAQTREADLLVIGAKSHSAVPHLLGGTAHKVANHAPCPILLVTAPVRSKKR
jgi:nucleotide-binding universal stress UspA family protein